MASINFEALRDYLIDYCGAFAEMGFTSAIDEVWDIEDMSEEELLKKAEEMSVDLTKYEIKE